MGRVIFAQSKEKTILKLTMEKKEITRRDAIKTMGAAAAVVATGAVGVDALAAETVGKAEKATAAARPLKVLLINGSPRPKGNTYTMLSEIAAQLERNGIASEIMQIGTKPVRGCIACGQCGAKRLGKCVFDDDVCNKAIAKMSESDGLIVGSPVYYGTPTGPILSLLHRMGYSAGSVMQGKPAAGVTVCRRGGGTASFQTLQMPFQMLNMPIVTSQYWNIAYGAGPGEVTQDEEGMQTMRTLADNMAYLLKQMASGTAEKPQRERGKFTNFIR